MEAAALEVRHFDEGLSSDLAVCGVARSAAKNSQRAIPSHNRILITDLFPPMAGKPTRKWSPTGKPLASSKTLAGRNPEHEPPAKAGARVEGFQPVEIHFLSGE